MYSKVIQLHVYIYPFFSRFFSHIGYYPTLKSQSHHDSAPYGLIPLTLAIIIVMVFIFLNTFLEA